MMKTYKSMFLLPLLTLIFSSCNDWLDVQPRSQVEDTELFNTESGYKEALAGVYSSMLSSSTYGKEMTYGFIDVLAHEWDFYYASQYDDATAFDYEAAFPTNYIRGIWSNSYSGIANVNNLLAHIDEKPSLFSADNHDVIKGEALALRAFLHFDLLRCFGVSFAVNPEQPAIPYSTALSYRVFPQLKVRDVAQAALDDLLAAEALLKADVANEYFADDSPYSFAVTRDRLLDYFDNATQDYRFTFLFKAGSATHANNRYLMKYDEPSGNNTYFNYKMPLVRLPEMYLIRSEVEYRNGNTDNAKATLNQLRVARNLPALNELPEDFYLELIREYRREFLAEGQLFFLYKRLNRNTILYADIDAVAEKVYTFPIPITETESAQREDNK